MYEKKEDNLFQKDKIIWAHKDRINILEYLIIDWIHIL